MRGTGAHLDVAADVADAGEAALAERLGERERGCELLVRHETREGGCPAGPVEE